MQFQLESVNHLSKTEIDTLESTNIPKSRFKFIIGKTHTHTHPTKQVCEICSNLMFTQLSDVSITHLGHYLENPLATIDERTICLQV